MPDADSIGSTVKQYILSEFLPGEDPDELADDTELLTSGVLDSIATIKLVSFLEDKFGILLEPHEMDVEYLNRICDIVQLVQSKHGNSSS